MHEQILIYDSLAFLFCAPQNPPKSKATKSDKKDAITTTVEERILLKTVGAHILKFNFFAAPKCLHLFRVCV